MCYNTITCVTFGFLAMGHGDLSSSTRDWTCTSCLEGKVLTTGLLVKSQQKSVFSQFWRPQVQKEGVDKAAPSGESIPCPSPSFWSCRQRLVFLGSGLYSSNLCSVFTGSPFLWCLIDSPFSSQGLSLGLGSTLIQDVLISRSLPSLYLQRLFQIRSHSEVLGGHLFGGSNSNNSML